MSVTKSQKAPSKRYIQKHDRVEFLLPKGTKDVIKRYAELSWISVNQYVSKALIMQIKRDKENETK